MFDLVNRAFLLGVGLASETKDRLRKQVDELIVKGKLSEKEGRELFEKALDRSRRAQERMRKQVDQWTRQTADRIKLVTKNDLAKLEKRIEKLESAGEKKSAKRKTRKKSKK